MNYIPRRGRNIYGIFSLEVNQSLKSTRLHLYHVFFLKDVYTANLGRIILQHLVGNKIAWEKEGTLLETTPTVVTDHHKAPRTFSHQQKKNEGPV